MEINGESYGYDKRYMDIELIEDKLHQTIDQFIEGKTSHKDFIEILVASI